MSLLELNESLWPITVLKMHFKSRSLGKFPSITASNFGFVWPMWWKWIAVYLQPEGSPWGHRVGKWKYFNQDWGGRIFGASSITNVTWGASADPCLAYLLQSPVNPHTARRCVWYNFLRHRRQEHLWRQYNRHNPLVNPRVHCQDDGRDGPVNQ